jgi:succinoglycan biosynthesis protein ExoM
MSDSAINPVSVRDVDVCVCTFRRTSVADLLASLATQALPASWRMRVIVADNDDTPSGKGVVEQAFRDHGLDGRYIHAPARNISVARNACLDAAAGELVAFVDDDETARPDWLAKLIAHRDRSGANVVFGKVKAVYTPDAPVWMRAGDMHSTPPPIRSGEISGGYTCNVLLMRAAIGELRFNPAFGRTGGEDTTFFSELKKQGVPMAYTEDAVVEELVLPQRYSLEWMSKRAFRSGQTWGLLELRNGKSRIALILLALAKILFCWAMSALTIWSPARWRKSAVRAQLHAGVLAAALGKAPLELYGGAA